MLVKCPCGAGGVIAEEPCGKDNTYKIAYIPYDTSPRSISDTQYAYPAANWVASINLNAPKLGKGNWWIPSFAEMVEMMRDITYGSSFWDIKPDIINRVLYKLNSFDSSWSMMSAATSRWTSSIWGQSGSYNENLNAFCYTGGIDNIPSDSPELNSMPGLGFCSTSPLDYANDGLFIIRVSPITIYEF